MVIKLIRNYRLKLIICQKNCKYNFGTLKRQALKITHTHTLKKMKKDYDNLIKSYY